MKIVCVPYSEGSMGKNKGCEKAPELIINELKRLHKEFSVETIELDKTNSEEKLKNLGGADIYIGGDHSITYYS
ncbi:MAG: hypothetical protein AABY07_03095, partial [Nanoarchaeota archaeon]